MPAHADPRRSRLVGLLVLGVAAVLLVTSVTWFVGDRVAVGVAQLAVAVLAGVLGLVLLRRAPRT